MHTTQAEPSDAELLSDYRAGKRDAFAELVKRHIDWVYSAARRQVRGDAHLAEDVTQAVFIVLAQRAKRFNAEVSLGAWLFGVTRYAAANARRSEERRRRHEATAANMQTAQEPGEWEEIAPVLDELVARLRPKDRQAVVLRFYQQKSHAEVGAALGCSPDAARKRLEAAVDNLRDKLCARGITSAALAAVLLDHSTQTAPTALAQSVTTAAVTGAALSVAQGAALMMTAAKVKLVLLTAVGCAALAAGTTVIVHAVAAPASQSTTPAAAPSTRKLTPFRPLEALGQIWLMRIGFADSPMPQQKRDKMVEILNDAHAKIIVMFKQGPATGDDHPRGEEVNHVGKELRDRMDTLLTDEQEVRAVTEHMTLLRFEVDLVAREKFLPLMLDHLGLSPQQRTKAAKIVTDQTAALRREPTGAMPTEAAMLAMLTARQSVRALLTPPQLSKWQEVLRDEERKSHPTLELRSVNVRPSTPP